MALCQPRRTNQRWSIYMKATLTAKVPIGSRKKSSRDSRQVSMAIRSPFHTTTCDFTGRGALSGQMSFCAKNKPFLLATAGWHACWQGNSCTHARGPPPLKPPSRWLDRHTPNQALLRARLSVRHPAIAKKPSVWHFGDGAEEASLSAARRTPPNIRHKCSAARKSTKTFVAVS